MGQARVDGVHPQEKGRDSSFQAAGRSGGSEEDEEQRGQEKERRAHRFQEGRDAEDPSQGGRDQIRSRRFMENRHKRVIACFPYQSLRRILMSTAYSLTVKLGF